MGRFKNKVVIVTGASSGIGEATAIDFAKQGAKLVITGRNKERLLSTSAACREAGAEVHEFLGDLASFENLELLINETVAKYGRIDILINNAGLGDAGPIEQSHKLAVIFHTLPEKLCRERQGVTKAMQDSEAQQYTRLGYLRANADCSVLLCSEIGVKIYDRMFNVNLRAPVFLSKYALPHLKISKGCIVNVSSCSALKGNPHNVSYSMTKAALDHFTRGLSAECASSGVRVNSINPALVETRFAENKGAPVEEVQRLLKKYKKVQKFGLITPQQVSEGILYLCTSEMTTGITLPIDGGLLHSSPY